MRVDSAILPQVKWTLEWNLPAKRALFFWYQLELVESIGKYANEIAGQYIYYLLSRGDHRIGRINTNLHCGRFTKNLILLIASN